MTGMDLPDVKVTNRAPPTKLDTSDPRYFKKRLKEMKRHKGMPVSSSEDEATARALEEGNEMHCVLLVYIIRLTHPGCVVLHKFVNRRVTLRPDGTAVKAGKHIRLEEADALRIAEANGLPVPHVHETGIRADGMRFIRMDFIEGQSLDKLWVGMEHGKRKDIVRQLRHLVKCMRTIEAPPDTVGGCDGKTFRDTREHMTYYSPNCKDEQGFNQYLLDAIRNTTFSPMYRAFEGRLRTNHRIVLSHCDLAPRNTMVKDGQIVALIDWEEAGWFPEYWDYVKFFQRAVGCAGWAEWADEVFEETYPNELVDYLAISRFQ